MPDSFDSKAVARNLEKAIPQAMAELNREIFYGEEPGETTVDVGQWVVEGGTLVPWVESSKTKYMRKLFESRDIHLDWPQTLYPGTDFDIHDPYPDNPIDILNLLLDGAPKLRAWIKNVLVGYTAAKMNWKVSLNHVFEHWVM